MYYLIIAQTGRLKQPFPILQHTTIVYYNPFFIFVKSKKKTIF